MDDEKTWDLINSVYCIGGSFEQWDASNDAAAQAALLSVKMLGLGQLVLDLALESVWTALRREIVPMFWRSVCGALPLHENQTARLTRFLDALQLLQNSVVVLKPLIERCEELCRECQVQYSSSSPDNNLQQEVKVQLRAALHSHMPASATTTLKATYETAFRVFASQQLQPWQLYAAEEISIEPVSAPQCDGCSLKKEECACSALLQTLRSINEVTWSVGIAQELCHSQALGQLVTTLQDHTEFLCNTLPNDVSVYRPLEKYMTHAVHGWLRLISEPGSEQVRETDAIFRSIRTVLIRKFLDIRITNIFSLVLDYPDSKSALMDMHYCLLEMPMPERIAQTLKASIECRLLHPGVKTVDVVHAYVRIIRALRIIDVHGVILDVASEPIKTYLRSRKDFVRYIVSSLTDGGALYLCEDEDIEGLAYDDQDPTDEDTWHLWRPDHIKSRPRISPFAATTLSLSFCGHGVRRFRCRSTSRHKCACSWFARIKRRTKLSERGASSIVCALSAQRALRECERRHTTPLQLHCAAAYARPPGQKSTLDSNSNSDLLCMLVDIYGSKYTFISEYRTLFAERLLSSLNCSKASVEFETKHLEHIKKRFGSNSPYISKIEVMIRDMDESRNINTAVSEQREADGLPPIDCLIVSHLFWPSFKEESFELPESIEQRMKEYDEMFGKLRPNRKLTWKKHLGQVDIELELEKKTVQMKVSPGQATVIALFDGKNCLSLQDVTLAISATSSTARRLLSYWVEKGILRESTPDTFEICEDGGGGRLPHSAPPLPIPDDDAESLMMPSDVQRKQELEVLWSYVLGMLSNLESLPLERIYSMLRAFAEDGTDCTQKELKTLLDQKVAEGHLYYLNGQYKVVSSA